MSAVIHKDYLLLTVLNRFGIHLGFGDQTIEEVCESKQIDPDFFLDIVNSYIDENYFPKKHLTAFSASQIITYLQKTHEYYLRTKVPKLNAKIRKLVDTSKADKSKLKLIENFFQEYKEELLAHIKREDDIVYPYILELERYFSGESGSNELSDTLKKYSIHDFADEHDNMEEKLYDLKSLLIKYLPEQEDQLLLHSIIKNLFELEKDLADHSRIEDNVLIPKIADIEKQLAKNKG